MALIKCPECGKDISDKATACPNCGYPLPNNQINNEKLKKADNLSPIAADIIAFAKCGDSRAQYNLGVAYEEGKYGIPVDFEQAKYWFEESAQNGDAFAQCAIGEFYIEGKGTTINIEKGLYWLERSANNGNVDAAASLGDYFASLEHGLSFYQEGYYRKMQDWLHLAAKGGNSWAQRKMELELETYYKLKKVL